MDWKIVLQLIEIFWIIDVILAAITIFKTPRDIASTWAWLLVLIVLPYFGFILYLFLGRQLSHDEIFAIKDEEKKTRDKFLSEQLSLVKKHDLLMPAESRPRARMLTELNLVNDNAILTFDNTAEIFIDGKKLFSKMIDDIDHAINFIDVEFYTFYSDELGHRILKALENAAARGVKVHVIYDSSGSHGTRPKFFKRLRELGGYAQPFISTSKKYLFKTPRLNYHLHRKLVIIDRKIGYIGGFNIGDQYVDKSTKYGHWRDTHLRVVGQAAVMMEVRFSMDWNTSVRRTHLPKYSLDWINDFKIDETRDESRIPMQIVSSGPDSDHFAIRRGYEQIISTAQRYVYIQTPYLIPEIPILESLIIAAKSGIDVRVMIPSMPDHPFVYRATEYYAKYLTNRGVKVYKYNNGFLHAKTIISGSNLSSVGSANQDYRSYSLNFEVNAFCYSPELTENLKKIFENDLEDCTLLTKEYFDNQSNWLKFKQYFSRLLSPLL